MVQLSLRNVCFGYGKNSVIQDLGLDVEKGKFTTLLGASGCGKTTILRLIAGFLKPASGEILIDGKNQAGIEVNEREIGFVFQDYALFPHMSVEQNILYGLKLKTPLFFRKNFSDELMEIVRILGLETLLNRFPHELSGGQQQRVALARSLILRPKILLMDEPLSSLDTKLRLSVREELHEIQRKVGITTIYVTHDQEEALSLSDTIAVMDGGRLIQTGIYFSPSTRFVAEFVGLSNIVRFGGKNLMIRPEWFSLGKGEHSEEINFRGKIISASFLGGATRFKILLHENQNLVVEFRTLESERLNPGDEVEFHAVKTCTMSF